jgi:lipid-A-disaccharide synthase
LSHPLVYLIVGEPSGDMLAARLMVGLKELTGGSVDFAGVGGEAMREEGLASLFPQADLAVMGYAEVVPRIPRLLRRLAQTVGDIEARRPTVVVTVDSWGFNGRVVKRLKERGSKIPRLHYVAPMVWAYKANRVHQLAERVDLLLCLLPNEAPLFEAAGLRAIHVGHPVLESGAGQGDAAAFRTRHGIPADTQLLCVLPGSRHSETSRLLPIFGDTVARLADRPSPPRIVIPTVETVAAEVERAAAAWRLPTTVVFGRQQRYDAFAASRAALAASGTVALELAMAGLPMAIAYRAAPATAMIVRRLLRIRHVCLLNILAGRLVVPEFLQEDCRAERLAGAVSRLMEDDALRGAQQSGMREALVLLGLGGENPARRAAREVLTLMGSPVGQQII